MIYLDGGLFYAHFYVAGCDCIVRYRALKFRSANFTDLRRRMEHP